MQLSKKRREEIQARARIDRDTVPTTAGDPMIAGWFRTMRALNINILECADAMDAYYSTWEEGK